MKRRCGRSRGRGPEAVHHSEHRGRHREHGGGGTERSSAFVIPGRAAAQSRNGTGTVHALPDRPRGLSREPGATGSPPSPGQPRRDFRRHEGKVNASRIALPRVRDDKGDYLIRIDELERLGPLAQKAVDEGRLAGTSRPARRMRVGHLKSGLYGCWVSYTLVKPLSETRSCFAER